MRKILFFIFSFFLLMGNGDLLAQKKKKDKNSIEKYIPTETIDYKDDNKRRNRPKRKKYKSIILNKPKKTLYGNPCAIEATRKMGFEYVLQVKNTPGSYGEIRRIWNNARVKTLLCITRTPFWKVILNKKIEKCRIKSGDKTG